MSVRSERKGSLVGAGHWMEHAWLGNTEEICILTYITEC